VSDLLQCILVATDRCRSGPDTRRTAIALARKLHASLRIVYVVDVDDARILAPGPPYGSLTRQYVPGSAPERELVSEGEKAIEAFAVRCDRENVRHTEQLLVGPPAMVWGEEARACDLALIRRVDDDFRRFDRWFGSKFSHIVARSGRPVLILRQCEVPSGKMVLFYRRRMESARALPWVATICSDLDMGLVVCLGRRPPRPYARDDVFEDFLNQHQMSATVDERRALPVLREFAEGGHAGLDSSAVLAFDVGFHRGAWFRKRRRLMERVIRTTQHGILLCP